MSREIKDILVFGQFRLDTAEALLTRQGAPVPLPPKVFDLLAYLAANAGRLIEKEELLKALWPDSFVEEANLTVNVAALRRVLGTRDDGQGWIETVPKRGYRFIGTVTRPDEPQLAAPAEPPSPSAVSPAVDTPRPNRFAILAAISIVLLAGTWLFLRSPWGRAPLSHRQSIGVLPFQNLSPSGEDADAGLGMADALITRLGALPELSVRPIATVRKYDSPGIDPIEAGKSLGVDTVLAGAVQRLDKRIRVTVRLIRVQDGQSLWAEKFDEFFTNIFAVQDAISEKLAQALALRLTSEEQDRMMRRYTENTEAFRQYELGRYERYRNNARSLDHFKESIRLDPRYVLPYVELVDLYLPFSGNGGGTFEKYAPLAREAAASAMQFGPDLAEAHVASAEFKRVVDRDFPGARRELDTALRLNPESPRAHHSLGALLAIQGELTAAVAERRHAMDLDPLNGEFASDLAWTLYCARQYDVALQWIAEYVRRDPRHTDVWNTFYCYLQLGRHQEAIRLMEEFARSVGARNAVLAVLAHAYALSGNSGKAKTLIDSLPAGWGNYQRAVLDLTLGDRESALLHLDRAVDERSVFVEWLKVDPDLEPLRADPRFAEIVARIGLTP